MKNILFLLLSLSVFAQTPAPLRATGGITSKPTGTSMTTGLVSEFRDAKGTLAGQGTTSQRTSIGMGLGVGDKGVEFNDVTTNAKYRWDGTQWVMFAMGQGALQDLQSVIDQGGSYDSGNGVSMNVLSNDVETFRFSTYGGGGGGSFLKLYSTGRFDLSSEDSDFNTYGFNYDPDLRANMFRFSGEFSTKLNIEEPVSTSVITAPAPISDGNYYLPISVNGNFADANGNITDGGGSSTTVTGTPNQIDVTENSPGVFQVGLADNVTVNGNLTVAGISNLGDEVNLGLLNAGQVNADDIMFAGVPLKEQVEDWIGAGLTVTSTITPTYNDIENTFAWSVNTGSVTNDLIAPGVSATKIADGSVNNAEYQSLDGVTGALQPQINSRELTANKATNFATVNNTLFPTIQAVVNYVTGLGYALDNTVVHLAGTETISGQKNFTTSPTVPDATSPTQAVNKGQLDSKADDNSVVKLTGNQNVAGVKTFSSSPKVPTPTTTGDAAPKEYVDAKVQNSLASSTTIAPSATAVNTAMNAKIGIFYRNYSNTTGITANTEMVSDFVVIPANTFDSLDDFTIRLWTSKTGSAGNGQFRIRVGTTLPTINAAPPTSTIVATLITGATSRYNSWVRTFRLVSGNLLGFPFSAGALSDETNNGSVSDSTTFNPAVTNYLMWTAFSPSAGDASYYESVKVTF